jgi:ribonuclease HI
MGAITAIFADGGCVQANPSPFGGTWAWAHVDAAGRRVDADSGLYVACGAAGCTLPRHWPEPLVTNNQMELAALILGLEALPDGWSGTVYSDSQISLRLLFGGARLNELPASLIQRGSAVLQRLGRCEAIRLDGHPTRRQLATGVGKRGGPVSIQNVFCDAECTRQAREAVTRYVGREWWGCQSA